MAKAKKKEQEEQVPAGVDVPVGADRVESPYSESAQLSLEKRIELFNEDFEGFCRRKEREYAIGLGVELTGYPRALVPRIVLVDLKKKTNGEEQQPQG